MPQEYECTEDLAVLNLTSEVAATSWLYTTNEKWINTVLFPITFCIGILGNVAFVYVVVRVKRMHTITNYYLANLAFADILYIFLTTGGLMYTYANSPVRYDTWVSATVGCFLLVVPLYASYEASMCILTLVTLERYYGIVMPLKHRVINTKSRTIKLIALSWVISLALGTGATLIYGRFVSYCVLWPVDDPKYESYPDTVEFCEPVHPKVVVFSELCKSVPFFIALVWNGYMYAKIIYCLGNREVMKQGGSNPDDKRIEDQMIHIRNQVVKMLIINGSIFFLCQVWTRIASLDVIFAEIFGSGFLSANQYNVLLPLSRGMLFINGTVNPFVYIATSRMYRQAFKEALFGCVIDKHAGKETAGSSSAGNRGGTTTTLTNI